MERKKNLNAIIIGAGPIGSYLAKLLKKQGITPLLIEEHKELGRPVHCAGLVGKKVFDQAKMPLPTDCILNTINGAVVHLGKDEMKVEREEVAYVIDREKFDKTLGKGLNISFGTKFLGLEKEGNQYIIETDKGDLKADIVIGADGARSSVREFVVSNNVNYLKGVQFRMKLKPQYHDMVEVFVKKPYFYWIIPEKDNVVRIGVISRKPYQDLLSFIKERDLNGEILEKFGGIVPLTHFTPLAKGRVFIVGDSASQMKPLTYGGIYLGMRAAEILAECIVKGKFSQYTSLWIKRFGKEIGIAQQARHVFSKLKNKDIQKIFSFVKEKSDIIEKRGDFENHSTLVWEFLKNPNTSKEISNLLFSIVRASFINGS